MIVILTLNAVKRKDLLLPCICAEKLEKYEPNLTSPSLPKSDASIE